MKRQKPIMNELLIRRGKYKKYPFTLLILTLLAFVSCEKVIYMDSGDTRTDNGILDENSSAHINDEGWMVYTPDTITNFRNPGMGWSIYEAGWSFEDPSWAKYDVNRFWSEIEACNATSWSNILYIRLLWGDLETEEGKYAWDDPNSDFSVFVRKAKEHNLKLAFRVHFHGKKSVPDYVVEKGAAMTTTSTDPKRHPKVDDPVFLSCLDKFVEAFAAKFDDPDLVDYVDGYNIGHWGEGNTDNGLYHNPANKEMVIDVITGIYAKHFKKVLTCTTFAEHNAGLMRKHAFGKNGFLPRRDGVGGPMVNAEQKLILEYTQDKKTPFIGEAWYWFTGVDHCNQYKDPIEFKKKMVENVNHMIQLHSNVCDGRVPLECQWWETVSPELVQKFITNGGYRLYPDMIKYNQSGRKISVFSVWRNYAHGLLPNNHPNWNKKYQVSFALIDKDGNVKYIASDSRANPGDWSNGVINQSNGNGSDNIKIIEKRDEKYMYITPFEIPKDVTGEFTLCTGITDKTKNNEPGIEIAVPKDMKIGKWVKIANVKL